MVAAMNNFSSLSITVLFAPALTFLSMALPVPTLAQSAISNEYAPENVAKIDILPGWRQADGSHVAALRIRLAEGWKTYWRAPGDGGIPPSFDWTGSQNLYSVAFHWPVPDVFHVAGLRSVGYHDELILPMQFSPNQSGQKITLEGRVFLGVCRDVCIPIETEFSAVLNVEGQGAGTALIRQALLQRPDSAAEAGLSAITCNIEPISDGMRLTAHLTLPQVGPTEFAVVEVADQRIWVSEAELQRDGQTLSISSDLVPPSGKPFVLARSDIRITVLAAGRAVDIQGCVSGK